MNWNDPTTRRRLIKAGVWVAVILAYVALGIEDWGRDLLRWEAAAVWEPTRNEVSAALAAQPGLIARPRLNRADLAEAVRWAGRRIRNLEYVGETTDGNTTLVLFVRTHRLWRIKDDVVVRIEETGRERVVSGHSESRLHLGDLGRNPKNLRRLFVELEDVITGSNLLRLSMDYGS